ncbi:MAG: gamma carbonic anhydrase family protein [Bacteroidota bacterium]|nr:gamma carbonic anhydrase family protein [Candidatus Kapabacteria bacterium]MCS7302299.1 gamma carbonic anhydrase family protein [Candidatus Kapabacteria bacterium]MCX7936308.1 gamma carbonic anhydrase family protein [Chlorobiota bacterium]MDW8074410.1 gamma carbonic anhydrase family protein [Bacteroidota bacterium]MDW8271114.1 gamma carbonic anhydrase family protein [Bacteroidota bacterium]
MQALILPYHNSTPLLHPTVVVMPGAVVVGDVVIGEHSSVWFNSVIRGDVHFIRIGARTNIQDLSMLHVTNGRYPLTIGNDVTIGHRAIIHGCTVEDTVLIGMGAILLDGCRIGSGSIVAAGAVVREGEHVPSGVLVAGVPARIVRELSQEERDNIANIAAQYVEYATSYRSLHTPQPASA